MQRLARQIAEAGPEVNGWQAGDRVQVIAAIPCGRCGHCRRGWTTVCPGQEFLSYQYDGGFAEYLVVPAALLAAGGLNRIPAGTGFAEASLTEPLACVLNGQELARVGPGDEVVVVGSGPVGCLHVRLARARGAARVFLTGRNPRRLALAAGLAAPDEAICSAGADPVAAVRELTGGRGADVVILAASSRAATEQAVRMAAPRGRISLFSGLPRDDAVIGLDANSVHYSELSITGAGGSGPAHNARALALIASGEVKVADLITHRLPLSELHQAFDVASRGDALKVTIEP